VVTTDGNYSFENLSEGLYTIYAISDPSDGTPNIPSYNGDELFWGNSWEININQNLTDINIKLEQYTSAPVGNGSISGHIYYDSEDTYETDIYDNCWFGTSSIVFKNMNIEPAPKSSISSQDAKTPGISPLQ
jgi:hypothetical protein